MYVRLAILRILTLVMEIVSLLSRIIDMSRLTNPGHL